MILTSMYHHYTSGKNLVTIATGCKLTVCNGTWQKQNNLMNVHLFMTLLFNLLHKIPFYTMNERKPQLLYIDISISMYA